VHIKAQRGVPRARFYGAIGTFIGLLFMTGIGSKLVPALRDVLPVVSTLGIIGVMGFVVYTMVPKYVGIEVRDGRVVVGGSEEWSLRGAVLGPLRALEGTTTGTVLHLVEGPRPLRIGAPGHRVASEAQAPGPPIMSADLLIAPLELDAIRPLLAVTAPPASDTLRVRLVPNRASFRGLALQLLPSAVALIFIGVLTQILPSRIMDSLVGQAVAGVLAMAVFFGTAFWMLRRAFLGAGGRLIEVGPGGVQLFDVSGTRLLARSAPSEMGVGRSMHVLPQRHGRKFPYPSMTLEWPGQASLSVGVLDIRYGWTDVSTNAPAPRYLVGFPDWEALVDALDARAHLEVTDRIFAP
jgi:hypothetical protein